VNLRSIHRTNPLQHSKQVILMILDSKFNIWLGMKVLGLLFRIQGLINIIQEGRLGL
jgi:hypothetical protein